MTTHLLIAAALLQIFMWMALVGALPRLAEALDTPIPASGCRSSHVSAARRALTRTAPPTAVALTAAVALTPSAVAVVMPVLAGGPLGPSDTVQGVFAAVYVSGVCLTAVLLRITFGLLVRLGRLSSAR